MYKPGDSCPTCDAGKLSKETITEEFEYKNKKLSIPNYIIFVCNHCEEEFVSRKTIRATEKELTDFRRQVDGLLTSAEIKVIRKRIGKTQTEMSFMFGYSPKTFARYESGKITQNKAMDILLRLLDKSPDVLNQIDKQVKFNYDKVKMPPIPCCADDYPKIKYKLEEERPTTTELSMVA